MTSSEDIITSAEALENAAIPRLQEIHTDPEQDCASKGDIPDALKKPTNQKSPAQWAYERIILYIQNFEKTLDNDHEVGMGFAGGDAGVMRIEGLGFYDPDIVTYYGINGAGQKAQMADHKHGEMDITVQQNTFDGFMKMVTRGTIAIIVFLIFLAGAPLCQWRANVVDTLHRQKHRLGQWGAFGPVDRRKRARAL